MSDDLAFLLMAVGIAVVAGFFGGVGFKLLTVLL